jgi:hypothetical protein
MFGPKTKVDTIKYSDDDSIYLGLNANRASSFHYDENSPKRQKICHKSTEVVGQVHGTDSDGILRILLDTGASAKIILKDAIWGVNGPVIKEQPTKCVYTTSYGTGMLLRTMMGLYGYNSTTVAWLDSMEPGHMHGRSSHSF